MLIEKFKSKLDQMVGYNTYPNNIFLFEDKVVFEYINYDRIIVEINIKTDNLTIMPQIFCKEWINITSEKPLTIKEWLHWLYN